MTTTRLIGAVLGCVLLAGCVYVSPAERKEMRALRQEAELEATQAKAELDGTERASALLTIARLQDARRGEDELTTLSRHADPVVRAAAAKALGLVAEQGAAEVLVHLLEDNDDRVVEEAAFALSQIEHFRAAPAERAAMRARVEAALVLELDDCRRELRWGDGGRPEICRIVVRSLGAMGGEAANEALWEAMSKAIKPPALQRAVPVALAVQARAGRGQPITAEQLGFLAPLLIQTDNPAQWAGAYLLARGEVAEDAQEQARSLLTLGWERAGGTTTRVWTLQALGKVGGDASLVEAALDHEESRVRVAAIRAAGSLGLADALVAGLDAAPAEQAERLRALARIDGDVPASLWTWLAGDTPPLRALDPVPLSALGGLLPKAPEELVAAVVPLLADEDPVRRRAAAAALASLPSAEQALIDALAAETERGAQIDLTVALAERETPAVEGLLRSLVAGDDPIVGAIAAEGLAPRPGGHVISALTEAYGAANAPGDEERRLAIINAALPREDVSVDLARAALNDAEPLVREAAWGLVRERFDRSTLDDLRPPPRDIPTWDDAGRGVANVTGATIQTERGPIELELHSALAPGTVANWVGLAESGFYDGVVFHRVVADFVVQAGDPIGNGWGGPGHTIRCEVNAEPYRRGTLGMALAGRDMGGSQWFIGLSPQPHLDGRYTVFGQMTGDDAVLDAIQIGDRIETIEVHRAAPVPGSGEKAISN